MSNPAHKILFVDDDADVLKTAELLLRKAGYAFLAARNPAEACSVLAAEAVDAILLDLNFSRAQMSGEEGLACLRDIRRQDPDAIVIIVTGHSGLTVAIRALRSGAQNFIMKPWSNERLLEAIEEALNQRLPRAEWREGSISDLDQGILVGESEALGRIKALIGRYAPLTASVLVVGQPGTGKSLVAQTMHRQSGRSTLKIVEGASLTKDDISDLVDATVVLENVEQIDPSLHRPLVLWAQSAGRSNNRIVATTTRPYGELGLPRDLLYALSTLEMTLPPLHDRGEDIESLAQHFSRVFALQQGLGPRTLEPEALAALTRVVWKDNLHAFRRVIERAAVAADGPVIAVSVLDLPDDEDGGGLGLNLDQTEKFVIEESLKRHNFNITKVAAEIGLTRQALYRRMARHGL